MTTVAHPPVTATRTRRASRPVWRVLARAESHHLIRHPAFASGAAMSAVLVLANVPGVDFSTLALSDFVCLPLGVRTFVATTLAARRDAWSRTEELLDPLPEPAAVRTAAQPRPWRRPRSWRSAQSPSPPSLARLCRRRLRGVLQLR